MHCLNQFFKQTKRDVHWWREILCISEMHHNSIIFSLIIVENADPVESELNLGNFLKKLRKNYPQKAQPY